MKTQKKSPTKWWVFIIPFVLVFAVTGLVGSFSPQTCEQTGCKLTAGFRSIMIGLQRMAEILKEDSTSGKEQQM